MFSRNKPETGGRAKAANEAASGIPSIVSPDLKITGNLVSRGDVQVDGIVEGDVEAANLTIGENGAIHGKVTAKTVRLCGAVYGEIHGGTVTLAASARMIGDIVHESLAIDAGAHLEGLCRRIAPEQVAGGQGEALLGIEKPATKERPAAKKAANGAASPALTYEAARIEPKSSE